jgi:hypothetical protein
MTPTTMPAASRTASFIMKTTPDAATDASR